MAQLPSFISRRLTRQIPRGPELIHELWFFSQIWNGLKFLRKRGWSYTLLKQLHIPGNVTCPTRYHYIYAVDMEPLPNGSCLMCALGCDMCVGTKIRAGDLSRTIIKPIVQKRDCYYQQWVSRFVLLPKVPPDWHQLENNLWCGSSSRQLQSLMYSTNSINSILFSTDPTLRWRG